MNDERLMPDEEQTVRELLGDLVDVETVSEDTGRTWFPLMAGEWLFPAYRDPDGKQGVLMDKPLLPGESLRDGLRRLGIIAADLVDTDEPRESPYPRQARVICDETRETAGLPPAGEGTDCRTCPVYRECEFGE